MLLHLRGTPLGPIIETARCFKLRLLSTEGAYMLDLWRPPGRSP